MPRPRLRTRPPAAALLLVMIAAACASDDRPETDASVRPDAARAPDGATAVDAAPGVPDGDPPSPDPSSPDAAIPVPDPTVHYTSRWVPAEGLPSEDCTAWQLFDTAQPEAPVVDATKLTLATDADGELLLYAQTTVMTPETLVIQAEVRVVASASSVPHRSGAAIVFRLGSPKLKNVLHLEDGAIYLLAGEGTRGAEAQVATSDAAHTYRLEVDMTSRAIRVFRDGVHVLDGHAYVDDQDLDEGVFFGDASGAARGTSEWLGVKHNAHLATFCPP